MIPIDFSDPLTFPVVLPAGQDFNYPVKHHHLLDGSVLNMVHLFLVPEGGGYWFLWYIYFSSSAIMRLTFLVFRDISQQPLDELPTNFHGSKSMRPNDVGDSPTFPHTPPADWIQTEMSQQILNWFYNVVHNIVVFVCLCVLFWFFWLIPTTCFLLQYTTAQRHDLWPRLGVMFVYWNLRNEGPRHINNNTNKHKAYGMSRQHRWEPGISPGGSKQIQRGAG